MLFQVLPYSKALNRGEIALNDNSSRTTYLEVEHILESAYVDKQLEETVEMLVLHSVAKEAVN